MEALWTQRWRESFLMHILFPRVQSKVRCVSLFQNRTSGTRTGMECDWQVIALQNLYSRKKSKRSALPLCECGRIGSSFVCKSSAKEVHQEQSKGNLLQQPCTPGRAGWEGERKKKIKLSYGMLWCLHIIVIDNTQIPERDTWPVRVSPGYTLTSK